MVVDFPSNEKKVSFESLIGDRSLPIRAPLEGRCSSPEVDVVVVVVVVVVIVVDIVVVEDPFRPKADSDVSFRSLEV